MTLPHNIFILTDRETESSLQGKHYTNAGGAVAVRNDEREQYNIKILRRKWPGVFRAHPFRGPNEVRMYVVSTRSTQSQPESLDNKHLRAGTGTQRDPSVRRNVV